MPTRKDAAAGLEFEASQLRGRLIADATRLEKALGAFITELASGDRPHYPSLIVTSFPMLFADYGKLAAQLDAVTLIRSIDDKEPGDG